MSALELDGELNLPGGMVLGSPEQVQGFSLEAIMQVMTVRVMSETCWDTRATVAFEATDTAENCALEIRRGVCQFYETPPAAVDATMRFDRAFLIKWVFGQTMFEDAVADGSVAIDGDATTVADFLTKFEPFNEAGDIAIAAR